MESRVHATHPFGQNGFTDGERKWSNSGQISPLNKTDRSFGLSIDCEFRFEHKQEEIALHISSLRLKFHLVCNPMGNIFVGHRRTRDAFKTDGIH